MVSILGANLRGLGGGELSSRFVGGKLENSYRDKRGEVVNGGHSRE